MALVNEVLEKSGTALCLGNSITLTLTRALKLSNPAVNIAVKTVNVLFLFF